MKTPLTTKGSRTSALYALVALAGLSTAGCALTSKSEPVLLRYFTPERPARFPETKAREQVSGLELRFGRVNAASYIKDRIAFRDGALEIGYYEELRWTEKPESYLKRAVGRALFEERGLRQQLSGHAPTLELELDAFEEVRAPRHIARVQLTWWLKDETLVRAQRTFSVERAIPESNAAGAPGVLAATMSDALGEAVDSLLSAVLIELAKSPVASTADPTRAAL